MDAVCPRGDASCEVRALAAALHGLHLYCAVLAAALISCCAPAPADWYGKHANWRGQTVRGVASLAVGAVLCCGAATALLRGEEKAAAVAAALAPAGWLAAGWLHAALWSRRAAAPVLYLGLYWLLAAASSAAALWQILQRPAAALAVDLYVQALLLFLETIVAMVDCLCFYDEVTKRFHNHRKTSVVTDTNITYEHEDAYFYSKVTFFWLNSLLHKGYESPLENEDLRNLPENEASYKHYSKFKKIHSGEVTAKDYAKRNSNLWKCYIRMVWPNFYLAGVLKLFGDLMGVVPPLGLAVVMNFLEGPTQVSDPTEPVTFYEYFNNGYVIIMLMTMALIGQALLSQNSTHLVTVEGIRLKTALQGMIYDKCMRLAPWATTDESEEDSPLLHSSGKAEDSHTGLVTNLVSQDTYNIMSCVWICHYTWAIPFKVSIILYLLYTKLGLSAIIGAATSIFFITPLQFYIGKKISENSKEISKCTDHRISKITEILQGVNVIKLYVWEDLFNEKILNLREVELQLLNKDTVYWNFLTFSTQISTILVTVITFTVYSFLGNSEGLTAVNVFAGLALFNQLTVPLLILPVTVLMMVQAMVSTKRINDFLKLTESNNIEENDETEGQKKKSDKFNDAFMDERPEDDNPLSEMDQEDNNITNNSDGENLSDDNETLSPQANQFNIVRFQNTVFSWGSRNDSSLLDIDDLDIPAGKLIMVVGPTGSGKSSLLAAVLGEMNLERGDVVWNCACSTWYSGQPPWLLQGTVRDNIVMDAPFCHRRYARVLRATALRPDLQLLPDGDATVLGSRGTPLSGGQRVRVGLARALYSRARLVALDEPLGALDATLARHVVARALVPAVRAGRTVLLATNRLELMHYADLIIVMEDGRVSGFGRIGAGGGAGAGGGGGALARWSRLAAEARAAAARGAGPAGGAARERSNLVRVLSRAKFQRTVSDDVTMGISEMTGAHLLAEAAMCGGGSWRGASVRRRPALARQLSSPPAPPSSLHRHSCKIRRELRRVVSEDASSTTLRREASLMRRLLRQRPHRALAKWTPRPLRRLISSDSETATEYTQNNERVDESISDTTHTSITTNGIETAPAVDEVSSSTDQLDHRSNDCAIWWEYARACGWWGAGYWAAAVGAQALAVAGDCWLAHITTLTSTVDDQQVTIWWEYAQACGWWGSGYWAAAVGAQALAVAGDCWLAHITTLTSTVDDQQVTIWWEYAQACGWWGAGYWAAAVGAQALAVAGDCWLAHITTLTSTVDDQQVTIWWEYAQACGWWGSGYWAAAVGAQALAVAGDCWLAHITTLTSTVDDQQVTIWWEYAQACGWWGAGYWAAAVGAQALAVAGDCWLAHFTTLTSTVDDQQMWESLSRYAWWCLCGAALAGAAQAACGCAGAAGRRALHERLLHATLHAPLHHHHTTPLGDALHRFSADVQVIDKKLPTAVSRWAQLALLCGAAVLVNAAAAPWSLLAFAPTFLLYLMLQTVYLRNARELQRAEARSAAPIVSLAGEAGSGGATLRAARLQRTLRDRFLRRLDANHNALLLLNAANRWLGLTLDLVGAAAVCVSMSLAVCGGGSSAALAGLAGAHSLLLPAYLAHLAKCRADLDLHLGAVERVIEDADVVQEDYREDCPIPSGWQREGKLQFEDVSVQHEPNTAPTVTGVSLSVAPGEKIAVCGRSGSGKSTLLMSCVGAARVCRGRIIVDGADASTVPLRVLRHRLVVLPQEATLFSGTLRENLDPLGVHTDSEIWQSLRVVGLFEFVGAQSAGLECVISRAGSVWSAGRRGRACAARAVLRAPLAAALLLDEPAAALDAAAEHALLASIARAAPNTTILTVAHRISSVRGYDRAVVVDRGHVKEQGAPASLLAQPASRLARINAALQRDY